MRSELALLVLSFAAALVGAFTDLPGWVRIALSVLAAVLAVTALALQHVRLDRKR